MGFGLRSMLIVMSLGASAVATAQTAATPAHKPAPWKKYCQSDGGFCFKYPSSWTSLGEIFGNNGIVVAPPQKQERTLWDEITVAMVAPPPEGDEEGPGLNGVIEQATAGLREGGLNFETLQRQERTVDHKPAELLKVQYHDKSTNRPWVEELVFIEGPENEIYSVALKSAPDNLKRLEPVFAGVLESWTLPQPEPPAVNDDDSSTESTAPAKNPATTSPH